MERQQSVAQNEALKKKFSTHRFILSPVGLLKLFGIILFIVGAIISLSAETCSDYAVWLEFTFPIITVFNGALLTILYVSFILGLAKKIPRILAKIDITCCTITAIATLVLAILVLANCSKGALSIIPGVFGIIGSLMLFISSAIMFVSWLNVEEDQVPNEILPSREPVDNKRKSIFI